MWEEKMRKSIYVIHPSNSGYTCHTIKNYIKVDIIKACSIIFKEVGRRSQTNSTTQWTPTVLYGYALEYVPSPAINIYDLKEDT